MSAATHQLQQALAFFAALDPPNYTALDDLLHQDFIHAILPASLGGFGNPERNKSEFIDHMKYVRQYFERYNFQLQPPKDVIQGKDHNGQDVTILHLASNGKTLSGKPYTNEYIFIFRFQDGKIVHMKEFLDSKYTTDLAGGAQT